MNLRNVLRAYSLLRVLNDDETALLETLRAANDNERQLIAEAMSDKPQKKAGKKSAGRGGRSKRGESLQQQIQTARPSLDGGVSKMRCSREGCGEYADHNKHHLTTDPDYHEFQPVAASTARGRDTGGDTLDAMRAAGGE